VDPYKYNGRTGGHAVAATNCQVTNSHLLFGQVNAKVGEKVREL
jgi:hypothetical protein